MRALIGFVAVCFVAMLALIFFGLFRPDPAPPEYGTELACTFEEFCSDGFCDPEGPDLRIDLVGPEGLPVLALGRRPATLAESRTGSDRNFLNTMADGTTIRLILSPENRLRFQEYWPENPNELIAEGTGTCAPVPL